MEKGREIILKATMVLFILVSLFIGFIVYRVYESFNGSYFDKLKVSKVARKYMKTVYPDMDLEIKEIDYNYKSNTFSVLVYSRTSQDTYFDIYLDLTKRVERDSYQLVENGTTTFWRISFGYGDAVREAFEEAYHDTLAFCTAELRSDYLGTDIDHVVIRKTLIKDHDYDTMQFGRKSGLIEVCFSEPVVSERRLAELFLESKAFLDKKGIPFYMLNIILQDVEVNRDGRSKNSVSALLDYNDIDKDVVYQKILKSNHKDPSTNENN